MPCNVIPLDRALASLSSVARCPPREAHNPELSCCQLAMRAVSDRNQENPSFQQLQSCCQPARHFQAHKHPASHWLISKCGALTNAGVDLRPPWARACNGREPLRLFLSTSSRLVPGYRFIAQASRTQGTTVVHTMRSGTRPPGRPRHHLHHSTVCKRASVEFMLYAVCNMQYAASRLPPRQPSAAAAVGFSPIA
jgi:hypothetical protein